MDLLSRFALTDVLVADRRREQAVNAVRRVATQRRRDERAARLSLTERLSTVFGRTTEPANCLCV